MKAQQNQKNQTGELVRDEQKVLDDLIRRMDSLMLKKDQRLTSEMLKWKKAHSSGLPEAYGDLVTANVDYEENLRDRRRMGQSRDELYSSRMTLRQTDKEDGLDRDMDIKVGLHNYNYGPGDPLILGWFMPLCRHFILDEASRSFDMTIDGVHTEYTLEMKRKVDISFDKVKKVAELYSIYGNEDEKILADEFLQELLSRRNETEFRNIVFSIQKKQGEIISAPFSSNMIVQGCAGSGKSMIMLHRLPVVLFDNQKTLSRSSLYVITPSETYIQMARNMMADLEISDIPMGTIENYFDRVLGRYGIHPKDEKDPNYYGELKSYIPLSEEQAAYVYSEECIADIRKNMQEMIDYGLSQESVSAYLDSVLAGSDVKNASSFYGKLQRIQVNLSQYTNRDRDDSRNFINKIRQLLKIADELQRSLRSWEHDLRRKLSSRIRNYKNDLRVKTAQSDYPRMKQPWNAKQRQQILADIEILKERIQANEETLDRLDTGDYSEVLNGVADQLVDAMKGFEYVQRDISVIDRTQLIRLQEESGKLSAVCKTAASQLIRITEPFTCDSGAVPLAARQLKEAAFALDDSHVSLFSDEETGKLNDTLAYYSKIADVMAHTAYFQIMEKLGQKPAPKEKPTALSCSPYLYTQIMYQFRGAPNEAGEQLITIDEAQTLTPVEMRLIRNVNGSRVVLNLFGDVHQHIEGTKGVDRWGDLNSDRNFRIMELNENYRNAREITEFCNKTFRLNMQAINTSGNGVHKIGSLDRLLQEMIELFSRPLGNGSGYNCIIVKNSAEAESLRSHLEEYASRMNDMTGQQVDLDIRKWNLMTGSQAKGLEFSTVIAISGRMSRNEKYITYTRAMSELYVYDQVLPLAEKAADSSTQDSDSDSKGAEGRDQSITADSRTLQSDADERETNIRAKRKTVTTSSSQGLQEFLLSEGLQVVDDRSKGGYLWVIGPKQAIRPTINQAVEKFGISGKYGVYKGNGKAQEGWYTKTKK